MTWVAVAVAVVALFGSGSALFIVWPLRRRGGHPDEPPPEL